MPEWCCFTFRLWMYRIGSDVCEFWNGSDVCVRKKKKKTQTRAMMIVTKPVKWMENQRLASVLKRLSKFFVVLFMMDSQQIFSDHKIIWITWFFFAKLILKSFYLHQRTISHTRTIKLFLIKEKFKPKTFDCLFIYWFACVFCSCLQQCSVL